MIFENALKTIMQQRKNRINSDQLGENWRNLFDQLKCINFKNGLLPFIPILSTISAPAYMLAKILVFVLSNNITQNWFIVKCFFACDVEMRRQQSRYGSFGY